MAATYWLLPSGNKFSFHIDPTLPIPARPIPPWRQPVRDNSFLAEQFELSQPLPPLAFEEIESDDNNLGGFWQRFLSLSLVGSITARYNFLAAILAFVLDVFVMSPLNTAHGLFITIDWLTIVNFLIAVILSLITAPVGASKDDLHPIAKTVVYVLVPDVRRWTVGSCPQATN